MVRLVQSSGTVAIITSDSLSAPILARVPDVNMVPAAQAAALGAMVFSCFNDSLFWVVNRMLGVKEVKHQLVTWSVPTKVAWPQRETPNAPVRSRSTWRPGWSSATTK